MRSLTNKEARHLLAHDPTIRHDASACPEQLRIAQVSEARDRVTVVCKCSYVRTYTHETARTALGQECEGSCSLCYGPKDATPDSGLRTAIAKTLARTLRGRKR